MIQNSDAKWTYQVAVFLVVTRGSNSQKPSLPMYPPYILLLGDNARKELWRVVVVGADILVLGD
jgi:hypothetical protein